MTIVSYLFSIVDVDFVGWNVIGVVFLCNTVYYANTTPHRENKYVLNLSWILQALSVSVCKLNSHTYTPNPV